MSEPLNATDRKATVSESAGWIITGGRVVDRWVRQQWKSGVPKEKDITLDIGVCEI